MSGFYEWLMDIEDIGSGRMKELVRGNKGIIDKWDLQ